MRYINNDHHFDCCPFCNSSEVFKLGDLKYSDNLSLSTIRIQLANIPELWKCKSCFSMFTQNAIPPRIAEELYSMGEGSKRWTSSNFESDKTDVVIDYFRKNNYFKNKKLLDVGCNTGEFLDFMEKIGVKTYGLEICKESCDILKQKGHIAFQSSNEVHETFDVVTAFDLFEHLYDIRGFLDYVRSLLNPGGLFILLTGNPNSLPAKRTKEKWWYCNYPEHVVFPSPSFFKSLPEFKLTNTVYTYANRQHESMHKKAGFFSLIRKLFDGKYNGIPSFSYDHQFVVLEKIK